MEDMGLMCSVGHVEKSSLLESDYPHLTRRMNESDKCRGKPLQIGNTWPIKVGGKITLVVPEGGKCFRCETDMSGKVAKFLCKDDLPSENDVVVFPAVTDNISCGNRTCLVETKENWKEKVKWGRDGLAEFLKFTK